MQNLAQDLPRVAIIGAGPAGLEAALYARALGWRVWVFEREDCPAPDVRAWAHVSMFTPWAQCRTPLGEGAVHSVRPRAALPAGTVYPTGEDFRTRYLEPVARALGDSLHMETRVVAVGRAYLFPDEHVDDRNARAARRFRLLTRSPREERTFAADFVIDATGVSHTPRWLGPGGMPAMGEMGGRGNILYGLPDVSGRDRIHFLGKRILLVGDGPSAATVAAAVRELLDKDPPASLLWAVKDARPLPLPYRPHDPLPRRDLLYQKANLVAAMGHPRVEVLPQTQVDAAAFQLSTGTFHVTLQAGTPTRRVSVDTIAACTGAKPGTQTWERILTENDPGLFTIGAKAVRPGDDGGVLASVPVQVRAVFAEMAGQPDLDLYAPAQNGPVLREQSNAKPPL